jgi:diaminopimelate epimerase
MDDSRLRMTKHHGAGNDFVVLGDLEDRRSPSPELVRAICDRRYGVGADGLIRVTAGRDGADLTMDLRNADGTAAEMSGNGIRCLAQAAVDAGWVDRPTFAVWTPGGVRTVDYRAGAAAGEAEVSVDMGSPALGPDQAQQFADRRARQVELGNPHLVLLGPDPSTVDVAGLGERLQHVHPGGINVEFVTPGPEPGALTLRVWERGVGETLACGTGSVAAAAAALSWGLVGEQVRVHNPGGLLRVDLGGAGAVLTGPTRTVAWLEVVPSMVLAAARR